ncbi:MAG: hypothetical protein FD126_628 [Elusimicrobia bacterium]|nr:MAG: hypothetical protein FD126_628 [Elusimicrobiota bacterium]
MPERRVWASSEAKSTYWYFFFERWRKARASSMVVVTRGLE